MFQVPFHSLHYFQRLVIYKHITAGFSKEITCNCAMVNVLSLCTSFLIALYHLTFHSVPVLTEICSRQAYYTKYYRSQTGSSFAALSVFQGVVLSQICFFFHVLNILPIPPHHFSLCSISDTCRDISPENPFKT